MSIESLINKGCIALNVPDKLPKQRTIIVLGTARGGTSIAAGSLYHLGVPMFSVHEPVFEDINLSAAFESDDIKRYRKIIKQYNKENIWAWKRPSMINNLQKVIEEVRNPMFVVMIRDVLSVGLRNGLSMGHDVVASMQDALNKQKILVDFIKNTKAPVLLCSVEKTKQYPAEFIDGLITFCRLSTSENQELKANKFIEAEPMKYIEASRINRSHGAIGGFKQGILFGWAAWMYRDEPVTVELILNDLVIDSTEAIDLRDHGKGIKNKRDGYCGYKFDLTSVAFEVGDNLHVRVKGEVRDLNNSPLTILSEHLSSLKG